MIGNKINYLLASAVALVVLVDLATGQGPPIYTNYLQQQENYRPPQPPPLHPVGHVHRYDPKKIDKEYEKAIELGKVGDLKERKKLEKEYEKEYAEGKEYNYDKSDKKETEEASPGMFSSLSNRMSGAWKSISSFGREKRATNENEIEHNNNSSSFSSTESARDNDNPRFGQVLAPGSSSNFRQLSSKSRGMDNYEYLQYKNQGYIYFKVPKYLVCGQ